MQMKEFHSRLFLEALFNAKVILHAHQPLFYGELNVRLKSLERKNVPCASTEHHRTALERPRNEWGFPCSCRPRNELWTEGLDIRFSGVQGHDLMTFFFQRIFGRRARGSLLTYWVKRAHVAHQFDPQIQDTKTLHPAGPWMWIQSISAFCELEMVACQVVFRGMTDGLGSVFTKIVMVGLIWHGFHYIPPLKTIWPWNEWIPNSQFAATSLSTTLTEDCQCWWVEGTQWCMVARSTDYSWLQPCFRRFITFVPTIGSTLRWAYKIIRINCLSPKARIIAKCAP